MTSTRFSFGAPLRRQFNLLCLVGLGLLTTGCMSVKAYVDPALPKVSYAELTPVEPKPTVQLFFEFQTNKAMNAKATENIRPMVLETLKKSNLFADVVVAPAHADRKLFITINNFAVTKDAASKGIATGLTFGLSGTLVTDGYDFNSVYDTPGQAEVKHTYKHAIHTTVGNADGPPNLPPLEQKDAVQQVMSGLTLNMLKDMSRAGEFK